MYKTVEDGVGQGWVPYGFVPGLDRKLGAHKGGRFVVAIIEDLEKIAPLGCFQGY